MKNLSIVSNGKRFLKVVLSVLMVLMITGLVFATEATEGTSGVMRHITNNYALGIGMGIAVLGAAIGQGFVGAKAMESIGRNPESSKNLFIPMIIALAFIEALVLYFLLLALINKL